MSYCIVQNQAVLPIVFKMPGQWVLLEFNQEVYGIVVMSPQAPSYQGSLLTPPSQIDMIYAIEGDTLILINQYVNDYVYIYITYPLNITSQVINNQINYYSTLQWTVTPSITFVNISTWSITQSGEYYYFTSLTSYFPVLSQQLCATIDVETAYANGTVVLSSVPAFQPSVPAFFNPLPPQLPQLPALQQKKPNDLITLGVVGALGVIGYAVSKVKK
ncbi:hypothetical protein SBV1_gp22 [Sulfolobales Beppu virus 1]|nr:hypothetical protein SBV1_gp22 [Sulfolobales Beppu virus 1]